jgi:DNA-binding NarL/FixJ family response regulator
VGSVGTQASTRGPGTVLVADPDDAARAEVVRILARAGYHVLQTANGDDAIDVARRELPSLVVLEVPLAGLSGYEVCRSLRAEFGAELAIVFLSGARTESYDRVAGLLVGSDDYLIKPFAADELLVRLHLLLQRRQSVAQPALSQLTPREREILALLTDGLSAKEIAARLVISTRTVGTHIEHILAKLNVSSRVQAVAIAFREGLPATDS